PPPAYRGKVRLLGGGKCLQRRRKTINPKQLFVASAALFIFGTGAANAGQTINEAATMACVNDKWDEKEPEKGHKLVDFAGRCVLVPDAPEATKATAAGVRTEEYVA